MSEFHSLANLIKRLEVATTRLEDLAMSSSSASAVTAASPSTAGAVAPIAAQAQASNETPAIVEKQDISIKEHLEKYYTISQELGEPVSAQVSPYNSTITPTRVCIYLLYFSFYTGRFSQGSSCSSKRYPLHFYKVSKARYDINYFYEIVGTYSKGFG